MARKEIDEIIVKQPGFFGIVIEKLPHQVFIEKADLVDTEVFFTREDTVFFVYYHFNGQDLKTHFFNYYDDAKKYAKELSTSIKDCIETAVKGMSNWETIIEVAVGPITGKVGLILEGWYSIPSKTYFFIDYNGRYVLYKVLKDSDEFVIIKDFKDERDAVDYARYTIYPHCQVTSRRDIENRPFGIILKEYDYGIYLTYTRDLFVIYQLDKKQRIDRTRCYRLYFEANKKAKKWRDETMKQEEKKEKSASEG